jgi:hypothetical protein
VTLRAAGQRNWNKEKSARKLAFTAHGIHAPEYVGRPDIYFGEDLRDQNFCVVDRMLEGTELSNAGPLDPTEAALLGIELCDLITSWAEINEGFILRGLRPETIFVQGQPGSRRFTGALPRPYFLLGNHNSFCAYPDLEFDPPCLGVFQIILHDALFTVAMILWYAMTGQHPYVIPKTDTCDNEYYDKRIAFEGPKPIGAILESALVSDPASRIQVDAFKAALLELVPVPPSQVG